MDEETRGPSCTLRAASFHPPPSQTRGYCVTLQSFDPHEVFIMDRLVKFTQIYQIRLHRTMAE